MTDRQEESAGDERPVMSKTRREKVVEETLEIEPFTNEKRLANEFRIDRYLGAGSFGVVLEGRHKIDYKQYAIKLIYIFHENEDSADAVREEFNRGIREIRVWAKVQDTTCVQYRSAWLETSAEARKRFVQYLEQTDSWVRKQYAEQLNRKHFAILHIQMDLCWYSLKRVLIQVLEYFEMMNCREFLPPLGHYIGAELLAEIADALGRLHGAGVIHRDIKPDNILIRYDTDRRFVRMGDFGLAVEHLHDSHTHTRGAGADRYMAPEVKNSRKYNQKADMYSIGVVIQDLFNFDINTIKKVNNEYKDNYKRITEITSNCLNGLNTFRPSCQDILKCRKDWSLAYSDIESEIPPEIKTEDFNPNPKDQFVKYFMRQKYLANNTTNSCNNNQL